MREADPRLPVFVLTGFLGSGKTTLLRAILGAPDMADTAVVINEFGAIALDHLIVGPIDGETVVLRNGCVCCVLRDDLRETLARLLDRSRRGEIPAFRRIAVETTGLADPVPILQTLLADPMLRHQVRHEATIVTLDAVLGADQAGRHPESARQIAVADRLILTKSDIASPAEAAASSAAARRINPGAPIGPAPSGAGVAALFAADRRDEDRYREAEAWLAAWAVGGGDDSPHRHDHDHGDHDHGHHRSGEAAQSLAIELGERLDWSAFGVWLSALLHRHGRDILRMKGILDANDVDGPIVLQAVEHLVHPPVHLPAWPDGRRSSRLVFITRGLDPERIRKSLDAFLRAAARLSQSDEAA